MENELEHDGMKEKSVTDGFGGRAVTRSADRPLKVPGAVLSPESSRALQEELADIRRAERDGIIGADNCYLGTTQKP